jgi:hypothetical protein
MGSRLGRRFGTGKVRFDAIADEAFNVDATDIRIHGGGSNLVDPYAPDQALTATLGCVRLSNRDVNTLVGDVNSLSANGDPLDRVFVGTEAELRNLASQTDPGGNYLYADLRLSLGMYQSPEERDQLIGQDAQRRQNQANDANPALRGRPRQPRPRRRVGYRNAAQR